MWIWWRMLDNFFKIWCFKPSEWSLGLCAALAWPSFQRGGPRPGPDFVHCWHRHQWAHFRLWQQRNSHFSHLGFWWSGEWRVENTLFTRRSVTISFVVLSVWMLHNTPILPVSYGVFCGTFQCECYTTPRNVLCFWVWILFNSPILPVSYNVFCCTFQHEY